MKTIWKFPLELTDKQTIVCPWGFNPLSVQIDPKINKICIWAEVDPEVDEAYKEAKKRGLAKTFTGKRDITIVGTGHDMPLNPGKYMGTVIDSLGLVWHVYIGEEIK